MKTIQKAEAWYNSTLLPALNEEFKNELPQMAIGIAGRGSECFGFDDEISLDHDAVPGVTIWLTPQGDERFGFRLTRFYDALVKSSFSGQDGSKSSTLGDSERGVVIIDDFLRRHLGYASMPRSWQDWLYTPEYAFAECVNGRIFRDDSKVFSSIRESLRHGMPEDVRLKKIAAKAVMMAQSGQYNYSRCLAHNEPGAAAIALSDFVRHTVSMVFLLNFSFAPYYKWMFRAMRELAVLGEVADSLEELFRLADPRKAIEDICRKITAELANQGLSDIDDPYLEAHAFAVTSKIRSQEIRALHIMEG